MASFPSRYVVFDTETQSSRVVANVPTEELTLRLWCARIHDPEDSRYPPLRLESGSASVSFHGHISGMPFTKTPIYVFAHNMGFDVRIIEWFRAASMGLYTLLPPKSAHRAGSYKLPMFVTESPPFIVRMWRADGQQIVLLDSYQWLQKSLAEIGTDIGMPKGEMPSKDATEADWVDYCYRDCLVLDAALVMLWNALKSFRLTVFSPTPASQAMHTYRMRYEHKRIIRPEDPSVLYLDRLGYYGGRVDCFRLGKIEGPVHQIDVNSLYPYVMWNNIYPYEVRDCQMDAEWHDVEEYSGLMNMTAEVLLDSPEKEWPVRAKNGTYWVSGKVRTVLCGPELARAYSMGVVQAVGRNVTYSLTDLFSGYVMYFWKCRNSAIERGDKQTASVCKSLLNALHGKFGQRVGEWQYKGNHYPIDMYGTGKVIGDCVDTDTDYRIIAGHMYQRSVDEEDRRGFVPIAAWTASYGRMLMEDYRYIAGHENVFYQATDCLLMSGDGLGNLQAGNYVNGGDLGTFRYEGDYPWVTIHGLHALDLGPDKRRPGIRRNALQISDEVFQTEEWQGCSDGVCQGNVSSVSIRTLLKRAALKWSRSTPGPNGVTAALTVNNWHLTPEQQRGRDIV